MIDEKLDRYERYRSGAEMFAACMRLRGIRGTTP
jgi:hypothetical protein